MTCIKNILLACSLFLFTACSNNSSTTGEISVDTSASTISDTIEHSARTPTNTKGGTNITHYIETKLPEWEVPQTSAWEKYWFDRYKEGKNTVYRVQSDFDGNGQTDYAFILKDTADNHAVWAFLSTVNSYSTHRIYDITQLPNSKLHVGLSTLKAGSYDDLNTAGGTPAKVQTDNPAIHVIFFETAAKAYYWKDSSFHLIQTGD